jgi:hypothetical protein
MTKSMSHHFIQFTVYSLLAVLANENPQKQKQKRREMNFCMKLWHQQELSHSQQFPEAKDS